MAQVNLGHVVGPGVPTGGTAGQVLKKNGSTNFDASWATLNSGNIPISASDNTTVQQSLAAVKSDIGIVEDGNTATHTIAAGQYVIWKGALYTASAAIPSGTTLSSSNLTAVSDGGLNALNGNITDLNRCTLTILSAMSSEIQVMEGGIYTRGKTYIVNFSLGTSSQISTGETKLATVSPAPKERIAGIVLQTSNTKQVGSFQITRAGDIWVNLSEIVASNKDITFCAYGLVS